MKHPLFLFSCALLAAMNLTAAEPAAMDPADGQSLEAKITSVTVYADRAQVTRSA